jgi:poly(3-hydroxybutyrate) depolymerase
MSVTLYTIIGGGHSWPGADPTKSIGLTTKQINATSLVLSFFGHVRP